MPRTVLRLQERGNAAAARDVGLLHIDRVGLQHMAQIVDGVAVFAGSDVHPGRRSLRALRRPAKSSEETGSSNHATLLFGEIFPRVRNACLHTESAVGVDEQSAASPIA